MYAGILNKKVDFYKPQITRDELGQQVTTFTLDFTTRASLRPISGQRTITNKETFVEYSQIWTVRKYHEFDENHQIYYKDKKYRILYIDDDEQINCKRVYTQLINE